MRLSFEAVLKLQRSEKVTVFLLIFTADILLHFLQRSISPKHLVVQYTA